MGGGGAPIDWNLIGLDRLRDPAGRERMGDDRTGRTMSGTGILTQKGPMVVNVM